MKKQLLITLLLTLFPLSMWADWNSYIVNFEKGLYGKGAQTWQIMPYDDHWVFFANQKGMVQFDGKEWKLLPVNNGIDVRSVQVSEHFQRIYVGGINEFGYFEPGDDGLLRYHCMSDTLPGIARYLGNVWNIHECESVVYFQGDDRVVKYVDGQFTTMELGIKIDCSGVVDGILYVGTSKGIWLLVGNSFLRLQGDEQLVDKRIRGIVPYKDGLLIVTAYNGLYYMEKHTLKPLVTGAEAFMKENEVFCVALNEDKLALGTIHKGVLLMDTRTGKLRYYNEGNGLHNNTVLSVAFTPAGDLWVGEDSGVDFVCLTSPFTNLYSYPYSFGTGYAAALKNDILYLGTNRGLYYTSYPVPATGGLPNIRPVANSSGQVWNLCRIGDELFCLHDRGMFLVEGDHVRRVTELEGVWACQLVMGKTDMMYVGVYSGLYLLRKEAGEWRVVTKVEGFTDSCRLFEQESDRVLWVCNREQVIRVELNPELTEAQKVEKFGKEDGLPGDKNMGITKIDGNVFFTTAQGVYRFDYADDSIKPALGVNALFNSDAPYARILEHSGNMLGLNNHELCLVGTTPGGESLQTITVFLPQSMLELVQGFENLIPISESLMVMPSTEGFALLNLANIYEQEDAVHSLHIKNMYLSYPKDSLVYTTNFLDRKPTPRIDYKLNSVRFEYGLASFLMGHDVRYRYRLGQDAWSDYTPTRTKEYSRLSEGEYVFEVEAMCENGATFSDKISFRVLPPWYRTWPAYTAYFLLLIVAVYALYRWDDLRVAQKKLQAVVEKDEEMKVMEREFEEERERKEQQIMRLEKEKLEHDLQHKSQEMANLMINFVRKNEMLGEIKAEITKVANALKGELSREGRQQLLLINSKIDSNMQSDEVLARIEEQFDLIHNNFMKRLQAKHPDLSTNERMMCAYLKMNLSTKEIAPLLNISVRGVETIRYRLRKKFELEREETLNDYLDNNL